MLLVIYNRPGFTGERIKNPDSYSLDILRMNGTDSHTLSLNAGKLNLKRQKALCTLR